MRWMYPTDSKSKWLPREVKIELTFSLKHAFINRLSLMFNPQKNTYAKCDSCDKGESRCGGTCLKMWRYQSIWDLIMWSQFLVFKPVITQVSALQLVFKISLLTSVNLLTKFGGQLSTLMSKPPQWWQLLPVMLRYHTFCQCWSRNEDWASGSSSIS